MFGRPTVVLTPGVRLEEFPAELAPRVGPPVLLFASSIADRRKRADLAIASFALVRYRHPSARLVLMGEGDPTWAFEAAGVDAEVRGAVDLVGGVPPEQVSAQYRRATVTLLPAEYEAFGMVLIESLASGTPVVCADSGGMPEIVADPSVGRVVPRQDAEDVSRALLEAITMAASPGTPSRCRQWATQWSWDRVGDRHEALYRSLVGGWPASDPSLKKPGGLR